MRRGTPVQFLLQTSAAVILTVLTGVLGSPFLRILHRSQGALRFWSAGFVVGLVFWFFVNEAIAVFVGSIWLTLGLYSELEERGRGWKASGLTALATGSVAGLSGFGFVLQRMGITNWERFVDLVREQTAFLLPADPGIRPDAALLAQQVPSAWIILLVLCLGIALIFEDRLFAWSGIPRERVASRLRLLEFRLPDALLWVTLTAFLLTMVSFGSKSLAAFGANVVNVAVVLYFFQGLAILEVLLNSLRAGPLVRLVVYVILVGQLFFVLSLVGLIDFWVDFRRRLRGTGATQGNDSIGGSV